jgi:hypothetical protein
MLRKSPTTRRPRADRALFAALLVVLGSAGAADAAEERPSRVLVEFGIDAYQRTYYRPSFNYFADLPFPARTRMRMDMAYEIRANGQLEGPIDFWLDGGLEHRLSDSFGIEASLTHFCRHVSSRDNPYILNYNEAVGRIRWAARPFTLGIGVGGYVGGSPGLSRLVVLDFDIARLVLRELAFEAELKWADFSKLYYRAGLAFSLGRGVDLVLRFSRTYGLPAESFIGLRLASDGAVREYVDRFDTAVGLTPYHDDYKLVAEGAYRLVLLRAPGRRLLFNIAFDTPVLNGRDFFAEFWPERMLTMVDAQYEVAGRGFFAAWYVRYALDMPSDRAEPFAARLGTGLVVRNRADFDALDAPFRVEASAGYDFGGAFDCGGRMGVNTVALRPFDLGAELAWERTGGRQAYGLKCFAAFGKDVSIRPFLGIRKIGLYAMDPAAREPIKEGLTFGIAFLKLY